MLFMVRFAIVGYGNLGKGVESALLKRDDAEIVGIFSRRDPSTLKTQGSKTFHYDTLFEMKEDIDVCILCGGSAHDLPTQTPELSKYFNTVDSYDNHQMIKTHKENVASQIDNTVSIISVGWDPGLFSLMRLYATSILNSQETFWGEGISQGHSDALRRIEGVIDAIQVTVPNPSAMEKAREGQTDLKDKHQRVCYVVTNRKDKDILTQEIKTMPNYFLGYDTTVHYVTQTELNEKFPTMPHGGFVIGSDEASIMEFSLKLKSNPTFTAQVLLAYAYAAYNMQQDGIHGAHTVFDVAPKYLLDDNLSIL